MRFTWRDVEIINDRSGLIGVVGVRLDVYACLYVVVWEVGGIDEIRTGEGWGCQ